MKILNLTINRRHFLLVFFVFIIFTLGYGAFEFSKDKTNLLDGYANAGAAKCGCSKCHTIELNGCEGCHNSQQSRQESDDTVTRSEEPHGEDSANPENNAALQEQKANSEKPNESESANPENDPESQSSSVETTNSEPIEPKKEELGKSETVPNKSKNQQGTDQAKK